ncbi:winged helix DNA-binding domain-containing protein [Kribbella qitaiheensis]|uniref:Winged helix DNA-binding domain-containing protein n=1 Tax=Kribbella qitaiheensis TaxID=1544730 RepID=A0A7G6X6G9_9ACTN|nr:winged helix DNA-binding domain-containing protein [Kribbella qitaiheensis]QNE21834.1 winged helix DNA-binding domain-containing protein [Kribbella qitaiheensis]
MTTLSRRALNRATLDRQWLLERHPATALEAIEHLTGMQSQAPLAPYTGLWTRLTNFTPAELVDLMTDRSVVRLGLMRGTIHLVTASDALGIYPLLRDMHQRLLASNQTLAPLRATLDLDALAATAHRLLSTSPLDAASLGTSLAQEFPSHDPATLSRAARDLIAGVQVPPRGLWGKGGNPIITTLESWLNRPLTPHTLETLVLRYLAAYGPATPLDMQQWSGLTHLTEIFDRLGPKLRTYHQEDSTRPLYDLPTITLPDPDTPAPIRFLPAFDNLYLSHTNRTRILPDSARPHIFTKNGIIKPTLLQNGHPTATYTITKSHLTITPITPIPYSTHPQIETEAHALLTFLSPTTTPTLEFLTTPN